MAGALPGRAAASQVGVRSQLPIAPAVLLLVLNVMDGLFTLIFLQMGVAKEANPLMRQAFEFSPVGFMAFKLVMVNVGVWVLMTHWTARLARLALTFATLAYGVIVTWHLAFLSWLLFR
jgi:hypothetical protein